MTPETYEKFRRLISGSCGIELGPERQELLKLRVRGRMRELNLAGFDDYLLHVLADDSGDEIRVLQDSVTTNYTFFFREPDHLKTLQRTLLERANAGQRRFRIWSAGCSYGHEPYSIAMTLLDTLAQFPGVEFDAAILAADVSTRVLAHARRGEYDRDSLRYVPAPFVSRYFSPASPDSACPVSQELRNVVHFKRMNLAKPPFPMRGPFDAIFCRNVMIYFDPDVRRQLVRQFESLLGPDGLLFVGMTESAIGLIDNLEPLEPSVYRKSGSTAASPHCAAALANPSLVAVGRGT
jgi:chemotaxis protein methyltransferase CheR